MTLTAALKTGNYRNSQAVGRVFMHSSFTAAIHQGQFCTASDITVCAPAELWLTQRKILCTGGRRGTNPPPPTAARLLDTQKPTDQLLRTSSFPSSACFLSTPLPHSFCPNASVPSLAELLSLLLPLPSEGLCPNCSSLSGRSLQEVPLSW